MTPDWVGMERARAGPADPRGRSRGLSGGCAPARRLAKRRDGRPRCPAGPGGHAPPDRARSATSPARLGAAGPGRGCSRYVVLVTAAAVGEPGTRVPRRIDIGHVGASAWVIAALALVVDLAPFRRSGARRGGDRLPVDHVHVRAAASAGASAPAVVVQTLAVVVSSVRLRHAPWRAVFNAAQYALAFAAAARGAQPGRGCHRCRRTRHIGVLGVLGMLLAAVVWFVVNDVLVTTAVWLRFGGGWRQTLAGHVPAGGAVRAGPARPRAARGRGRERERRCSYR